MYLHESILGNYAGSLGGIWRDVENLFCNAGVFLAPWLGDVFWFHVQIQAAFRIHQSVGLDCSGNASDAAVDRGLLRPRVGVWADAV